MNREIKFRAWIDYLSVPFMAVQGTPDLETLFSFMFHYGEEEKLMQFTGLKDKNGVEIYEGDIIKTERNTIEVFYGKKDFNVIFYGKKDIIEVSGWLVKNKKGETDVLDASFCEGEIIGNIYQNPELLSTT